LEFLHYLFGRVTLAGTVRWTEVCRSDTSNTVETISHSADIWECPSVAQAAALRAQQEAAALGMMPAC